MSEPTVAQIIDSLERWTNYDDHDSDPISEMRRQRVRALIASHKALVAGLKDLLHAVCDKTGFAAAVREDSGLAYPWEPLDIAEEKARAALEAAGVK